MKTTLRILALTLALVLLLGSVAFAESDNRSVPATITNIIFASRADLEEAYGDPELRGLLVGPLVLDTLLQSDLIDAETLLGMIQEDKVYLAHDSNTGVYSCYIYGKTGDFHVFFSHGTDTFRAGYDAAASFSDTDDLMEVLFSNGLFTSYHKVSAIDALAAISALLDVLQNQ